MSARSKKIMDMAMKIRTDDNSIYPDTSDKSSCGEEKIDLNEALKYDVLIDMRTLYSSNCDNLPQETNTPAESMDDNGNQIQSDYFFSQENDQNLYDGLVDFAFDNSISSHSESFHINESTCTNIQELICWNQDREKTEALRDCDKPIVDYSDTSDTSAICEDDLLTETQLRTDYRSDQLQTPTDTLMTVPSPGSNHSDIEENMSQYDDSSDSSRFNSSTSSNEEPFEGKKRRKAPNKSQMNKKRRTSGRKYLDYKNELLEKKKVLPNPCRGKNCVNHCNTFREEERTNLFSLFWKLESFTEKRSYINGCVNVVPVKRKRAHESSRHSLTYQYFFMKNEVQKRVCLQFYLKTLNISQKLVRIAIRGKIQENLDKRGQTEPRHKLTPEQMDEFHNFIKSLPKVPSHYCRNSSSKLYLPADIKNMSNLHRMYSNKIREKNSTPLKISSFKKFFKRDYNIGIHVPRKDKCSQCVRFENMLDSDKTEKDREEFLKHQKDKDRAKELFLSEQNRSSQHGYLVVSFDLQKVLATPKGASMLYGFSRKYAVYNFTVYESKTKNGYCYLWGEKDGKWGK
ncbi:uncharacterized protein [Leptinotarsa decemlineata]|uniref:uncharacterized protein n=1 Tax=Leptinotarsa decemlineata TaxID=7539 RepID=UPI003D3063EA